MLNTTMLNTTTPFTREDALALIKSILTDRSDEDCEIGTDLLINKFKVTDLNAPVTKAKIKHLLPKLIDNEKLIRNNFNNATENNVNVTTEKRAVDKKPKKITYAFTSKKEADNVKTWDTLSTVAQNKSPVKDRRLNQFVIALGSPDLPRRHPGVDDSYHPEKDMDGEHLDLLSHGNTTLQYINNSKDSKKPCTNLIFLRGRVTDTDDPLTKRLMDGHTLDQFIINIQNENQLPIEMHLAGHGNPRMIGAMTQEKRFGPEDFAVLFDNLLNNCGLKTLLKSKKEPLVFHFHVCNSAYADIAPNEADDAHKQKIMENSFIGRFYRKMLELNYDNFKVKGYRGYYEGMLSGSGIRVLDSLQDKDGHDAAQALYTIERRKGKDIVELPKRIFPIEFPHTATPRPSS